VTITGGFVSERRELEYYFDVAQAIQDNTGIKDFNGTAVIGAPLDLSVIEKYKEAGYRTIGINIEIWDKNIFKAICPGKEKECGGWEHWVKALEEAVEIFGHGRVRSSLVSGIEPRQSILEGVEYLASKGVICFAFPWCPNPGSALEGHRTPEPSWHFDISKKVAAIFKKAGFTYNQLRDCYATPNTLSHDIFRFQDRLAAEGWE
jgi:biotin synthase-related radical SAM superfamily protein